MKNPFKNTAFLFGITKYQKLPEDTGTEILLSGRSNAGKSSALNALTKNKKLARISKTPGRTQMINFFAMDDDRALVDLPGYGYAKVPEQMKIRWQQTLGKYLETRQSLRGLMLMMDIRHPLKEFDIQMVKWANNAELDVHILLTKSDKLKNGAAMATLHQVNAELQKQTLKATVQLFSSLKKSGKEEAIKQLDRWFIPDEEVEQTE